MKSAETSSSVFQALNLWQFGDWESLAEYPIGHGVSKRANGQLALLSASANFQTGNAKRAHSLFAIARKAGCNRKDIIRMLVAGAYVSLGKAAFHAKHGDTAAAARFEESFALVIPNAVPGWAHQSLAWMSFASLSNYQRQIARHSAPRTHADKILRIKKLESIDLGDAWAGNTINTVIFRHHGLLSFGGFQYTAFYVNEENLRIVQRRLADNTIVTHDLPGKYNLRDAHNSISLGFDRNGCLHISYDHHSTHLRYRRTTNASDITNWTEEMAMTGLHESEVTYPTFICPAQGYPLAILYRDGTWNCGQARIKVYREGDQNWIDYPNPILSGSESRPWTSNPYWNHPARGGDGSLHLSFVWRLHSIGSDKRINNVNVDYAKSYDNGLTWQTMRGVPFKLPITQVNSETIHAVSPGSNLINQCSMALDSSGRPHIVYYADDEKSVLQYQHLWHDGQKWHNQVMSDRVQQFVLSGAGTLQIPISRPDIVIDSSDNVYVITRGDHTNNRLAVTILPASDYSYEPGNTQILAEDDVGYSEPVIDRSRWLSEGVLSIFLQRCEQPDRDLVHDEVFSSVKVLDFEFVTT